MVVLTPHVKNYDWGSYTALPEFCYSSSPTSAPVAEHWYGAHSSGSALCPDGAELLELIATDPDGQLGSRVAGQFGSRLPFLVKLLSASQPLSLQAHPSLARAQAGFEEESRWARCLDARERIYHDPNHKPELLIAISEFRALVGFRPLEETIRLLVELGVSDLPAWDPLRSGGSAAAAIKQTFDHINRLDVGLVEACIATLATECARYIEQSAGRGRCFSVADTIILLAGRYPDDPGVLGSALLNCVEMAPGDAIYIEPGQLHAYLSGTGLEVMANSDNVVRGGLTSKHVDIAELDRVLNYTPNENPRVGRAKVVGSLPSEIAYPTPVPDFRVSEVTLFERGATVSYSPDGPEILVCTAGDLRVLYSDHSSEVTRGSAVWIPASASGIALSTVGGARLFRVRA